MKLKLRCNPAYSNNNWFCKMSDPSNLIPLLYCILNFFFKVLNVCPGLLQRMSFVSDHFLGGKKNSNSRNSNPEWLAFYSRRQIFKKKRKPAEAKMMAGGIVSFRWQSLDLNLLTALMHFIKQSFWGIIERAIKHA